MFPHDKKLDIFFNLITPAMENIIRIDKKRKLEKITSCEIEISRLERSLYASISLGVREKEFPLGLNYRCSHYILKSFDGLTKNEIKYLIRTIEKIKPEEIVTVLNLAFDILSINDNSFIKF